MRSKLIQLFALMFMATWLTQHPALANRKGMMLETSNTTTTIQSVRNLAALGATLVRFPIYFYADPSVANWLNRTDAVLAECERLGVTLVIDFHWPSATSRGLDNENDFVSKWQLFANRFKNRGNFWYDLWNEPNHPRWPAIALRAARAIRRVDTRHNIVYSQIGVTTRAAINAVPLPGISRQVLQFHFYDWRNVQFHPYSPVGDNQLTRYPSNNRTRDDLVNLLNRVRNAGIRTGLPVYIGEVAISREHPNAGRFFRDFTTICDQMNINLTIHAYREADIWNYERNPSAWQEITRWFRR
jgi:hypothetical protein